MITLEKYHPEKIEEISAPKSRIKRMLKDYMRFENRIYGWMLGKSYHPFGLHWQNTYCE